MTSIVHVEVSGLTGSGKSAVMGEIEIALKALGLKVEHCPDFQAEKNGTHADWQQALELYQPTVVLTERNISRQPQAREEAQPVGRIVSCFASGLGEMRSVEWASGRVPDVGTALYTTPPAPEAEKLRVALDDSRAWHTERHKALSKQPPSPDRDWRKAEHAEEIARIEAALQQEGQA